MIVSDYIEQLIILIIFTSFAPKYLPSHSSNILFHLVNTAQNGMEIHLGQPAAIVKHMKDLGCLKCSSIKLVLIFLKRPKESHWVCGGFVWESWAILFETFRALLLRLGQSEVDVIAGILGMFEEWRRQYPVY